MEATAIKLFGHNINASPESQNITNIHQQADCNSLKKQEDRNTKTPMGDDDSDNKALKKPDKILPCPRCNSMDTKFCYYNNYNVRQPRHFCKSCQRYWTAGGTMRSMPVGSGRRKNKNPTTGSHFLTIPQQPINLIPPKLLSFASDDDCSSGSTVTTSNSIVDKMHERIGFHSNSSSISHVPSNIPWSYNNPWNCVNGPIYPSPYWSYFPWLPHTDSAILGKHLREGELVIPEGYEEAKKQKSSVLIPKTLRIDDPDEAAKSSIWSTLGIKNESICKGGIFKAFQTKGEEDKKHHEITITSPVLQANPAALSRSLCFQERA